MQINASERKIIRLQAGARDSGRENLLYCARVALNSRVLRYMRLPTIS
jgi:hypothetical protein